MHVASDRCRLYCQAANHSFYFALANKVEDGTPCDNQSREVCIEGICYVSINVLLINDTTIYVADTVFPRPRWHLLNDFTITRYVCNSTINLPDDLDLWPWIWRALLPVGLATFMPILCVSGTFYSRLMGEHLPEARFQAPRDTVTLTCDLGGHGSCLW